MQKSKNAHPQLPNPREQSLGLWNMNLDKVLEAAATRLPLFFVFGDVALLFPTYRDLNPNIGVSLPETTQLGYHSQKL